MAEHSLVLYEAKRQRKPQYYQFIKLSPTPTALQSKGPNGPFVNADAGFAWCEKCSVKVHHDSKNSSVGYHMRNLHPQSLKDYEARARDAEAKMMKKRLASHALPLSGLPRKYSKKLNDTQKQEHDTRLAEWIATSMRPIAIVEDPGLKAYAQFLGDLSDTEITLPCRTKLRELIKRVACTHRADLMERVANDCDSFSVTTDIWTDRAVRSFIGLTLHYVDADFEMYNWCLGVQSFPGKHDNNRIAAMLNGLLQDWHLSEKPCTMLLRDGASNAVKAAENLGVPHMSCVAHSIHLVVSGALARKPRGRANRRTVAAAQTAPGSRSHQGTVSSVDQLVDDIDSTEEGEAAALNQLREEACEQVETYLADQDQDDRDALEEVRAVVAKFRAISVYFHKSPKATSRLRILQTKAGEHPRQFSLDCPTRWNSTWEMLQCFEEMKSTLKAFEEYFYTVAGMDEFSGVRLDFPTDCDWLVAKCMRMILDVFTAGSKLLGGEGYSTLVLVLPAIRVLRKHLAIPGMFESAVKEARQGLYVNEVIAKMENVRTVLLKLLDERFSEMGEDLPWITVLDPRSTNMSLLTPHEKSICRERLVEAMVAMVGDESEAVVDATNPVDAAPRNQTPQKKQARMMYAEYQATMFGRDMESSPAAAPIQSSGSVAVRQECEKEIKQYFDETKDKPVPLHVEALKWWQVNGGRYPLMAPVARKWLGCVASTVACERMFSTSGNIVSVRRCKLTSDFLEDLAFIAHNSRAHL